MSKATFERKTFVQVQDENLNKAVTSAKNVSLSPVRSKFSDKFSTPRTALAPRMTKNTPMNLQKSCFKTPLMPKTPMTSQVKGLVMTPMLKKPKKLDFTCYEDIDLELEAIEPIPEQNEHWDIEIGDIGNVDYNPNEIDDVYASMLENVVELVDDIPLPTVETPADFDHDAFWESLADKLDLDKFEREYDEKMEKEWAKPFFEEDDGFEEDDCFEVY
uniref:Uncharacterized protein n=1 Tax=Panagrolaimus sp. JU765 TaxID=591449 RepID=A0AC34Q1A3_9BILA